MLAEDMGYKTNGEGGNSGKGRTNGRGMGDDDDGGDEEESNTFYEAVSEPDICLDALKITNDVTSVNKIMQSARDVEKDGEEIEGAYCLPQATDVIDTESSSPSGVHTSNVMRDDVLVDIECSSLSDQQKENMKDKDRILLEDNSARPKRTKSRFQYITK